MVATSQPLAAQAGLQLLAGGGTAADAAVAAATALCVVEPTGTSLGGDTFALTWSRGQIEGINGSGRSPRSLSTEDLARAGGVPERGPLSVTVPGAVRGWFDLHARHGVLPWADVLAPAIGLAEEGFPVSELIASAWARSASLLARHRSAAEHFLPHGAPPAPGQVVRLPGMAQALRLIAADGPDALYTGAVGEDIVATLADAGGRLGGDDLATHASEWVAPIGAEFDGVHVWECPPNGQGLAALVALSVAGEALPAEAEWGSPAHVNTLVEAMRAGLADAHDWVGDPDHTDIPVRELLAHAQSTHRADRLGSVARSLSVSGNTGSDTVYVAVVDGSGDACSLISSNYMGFGSGIVSTRYGIPLQNRGAGFRLEADHPNHYAPGKRPFHTIIPALMTRSDGSLAACFGVMGGHMQPQGHLQVAVNMCRYGMDPQRALDAPRFQLLVDGRLALESGYPRTLARELERKGHNIVPASEIPPPGSFGGGQVIAVESGRSLVGGSDPRKDGQAVALP